MTQGDHADQRVRVDLMVSFGHLDLYSSGYQLEEAEELAMASFHLVGPALPDDLEDHLHHEHEEPSECLDRYPPDRLELLKLCEVGDLSY